MVYSFNKHRCVYSVIPPDVLTYFSAYNIIEFLLIVVSIVQQHLYIRIYKSKNYCRILYINISTIY